jgi:ketosteroid isomerase-like protein
MDSSKLILAAVKFNDRINQRDLEGLAELMTDDHTLVVIANNKGETTKGKTIVKEGWREFFKKYPDYRNIFTGVTIQNNIVVLVGYSSCSFKLLDGPNMWTAKIRGERISEWRVSWLDERE